MPKRSLLGLSMEISMDRPRSQGGDLVILVHYNIKLDIVDRCSS